MKLLEKDSDYLMVRIDKSEGGCWLWSQSVYSNGYGRCKSRNLETGKVTYMAHRLSYQVFRGEIPGGKVIDHLCRVRNCINPDHLEVVSQKENVMRSPFTLASKNSAKTHCPNGHEYIGENVITTYEVGRINRKCRTCRKSQREVSA